MVIAWVHKLLPQISRGFVLGALALAALLAGSAQATTIGVIGDSYSAEYIYSVRNQHRNYVEYLGNFGTSLGSYGSWPSPRDNGYQYNWSKSGYTTLDGVNILEPGLSSSAGSLNAAIINLGINDFFDLFDSNTGTPSTIVSTAYTNITNMVSDLKTANPSLDIVLANVPDWGDTHFFSHNATYTAAVQSLNSQLLSYANGIGIPVIDAYSMIQLGTGSFSFGGVSMDTTSHDNNGDSASTTATDFWANPGHAGSIYHGIFANTVLTALNEAYGYNETLMTSQQIWNYATSAASDASVSASVVDPSYYVPYVLIPEPTSVLTLLGGGLVLLAHRKR